MKKLILSFVLGCAGFGVLPVGRAAVLTVTTTNNVTPPAGQLSLAQAISQLKDGDEIRFNISGAGPHYIATPAGGYAQITASNVKLDGYTQPGSVPNSNSILAPNNAQIRIVLDSRDGGRTVLDYDGYGAAESAMLGFVGSTNVTVRGLGFLARITENSESDPAIYCISFAKKASVAQISGCWFGIDPNGKDVFGANAGITGFRFREAGETFLVDDVSVGVVRGSTQAPADFNVFVGMKIPIIIEGANLRVSGNFINVMPNGTNDFNNAFRDLPNEGAIQVGRHGGGTTIGTDGDGVNDANERNVFGGVVPRTVRPVNGYFRTIEFYGGGPRTNIVVAGNYFGVGIDGTTRFTNGVPILSGLTGSARIGSDFDGVSDAIEGNLIYNNYPPQLFTPDVIVRDFIEGVGVDAVIGLRGNRLVNNFVPPVSPLRDNGNFVTNYYSKALLSLDNGIVPVLSTNTSVARLVGTAPLADTNVYPATIVDLYLPDPEGLTNQAPEWTKGFIQGLTYLGSFVEGSNSDLDSDPGEFSFDISRLNLPLGTRVTVTANFSQAAPGTRNAPTITTLFSDLAVLGEPVVTEPPPLSIARSGTSVTLSWSAPGFTLQSAPALAGPWANVQTTGTSHTVEAVGTVRFFRLTR